MFLWKCSKFGSCLFCMLGLWSNSHMVAVDRLKTLLISWNVSKASNKHMYKFDWNAGLLLMLKFSWDVSKATNKHIYKFWLEIRLSFDAKAMHDGSLFHL